jgi:hypothetical protein
MIDTNIETNQSFYTGLGRRQYNPRRSNHMGVKID